MSEAAIDPLALLRPRRKITGISAVLLPFDESGAVDWAGFRAHVERTAAAGLTPAVNMDTGYISVLDESTRRTVLIETRGVLGNGAFVAGAFVADQPGAAFDLDSYRRAIDEVQGYVGTPVVFQSYGLTDLAP